MASGEPVLFDQLDAETAERLARHPGATRIAAGYTSFLAMPLIARGAVVGCATFGRAAGQPGLRPATTSRWPGSWPRGRRSASTTPGCIDRERRTALALQRGLLPGPAGRARRAWRSRAATCRSGTAWSAATGTTSSRCRAAGPR